jgi:hypothetical protein
MTGNKFFQSLEKFSSSLNPIFPHPVEHCLVVRKTDKFGCPAFVSVSLLQRPSYVMTRNLAYYIGKINSLINVPVQNFISAVLSMNSKYQVNPACPAIVS